MDTMRLAALGEGIGVDEMKMTKTLILQDQLRYSKSGKNNGKPDYQGPDKWSKY